MTWVSWYSSHHLKETREGALRRGGRRKKCPKDKHL
jgi:hypothetical protein